MKCSTVAAGADAVAGRRVEGGEADAGADRGTRGRLGLLGEPVDRDEAGSGGAAPSSAATQKVRVVSEQ